jgi:WD40 repeat protein
MKTKLNTPKIFLSILVILILSCAPVTELMGTPDNSDEGSDQQATYPQTATTLPPTKTPSPTPTTPPVLPLTVGTALPQLGTVISSDNVERIVEIAVWTGHGCSIFDLTFSPNSQILASTSCDNTLRLWDLTSGTQRANIGQSGPLFGTDFSPDGARLVAWFNYATTMLLYDVASSSQLRTIEYAGSMTSADFSPDGKTLATATRDGLIIFWDFTNGTQLSSLKPNIVQIPGDSTFPIGEIKFSPDGEMLASADGDNKIRLWELASGTVKSILDFGDKNFWKIDFSSDGSILMVHTASYLYGNAEENGVEFFDMASGKKLHELKWDVKIYSLRTALSPNGVVLAVGFPDGTIILYDVASGRELRRITAHIDRVDSIAFSPDGKFIAMGSGEGDRTIKLWGIYP